MSAEHVIVDVLVLFVFLLGVFGGFWYWAHDMQLQAAQAGVQAARSFGATAADGQSAAQDVLAMEDTMGLLGGSTVQVDRGTDLTTVTVTSQLTGLFAVFPPTIHVTVSGPTERITTPGGGTP